MSEINIQDWLPNWKDANQYPSIDERTDFSRIAWEFLRRNPIYQKDYQRIYEKTYHAFLEWGCWWEVRICIPYDTPGAEFTDVCSCCGKKGLCTPVPWYITIKYGLSCGVLQDPANKVPNSLFYFPGCEAPGAIGLIEHKGLLYPMSSEDEDGPQADPLHGGFEVKIEEPGETVVFFDLSLPIDRQLKKAGEELKALQKIYKGSGGKVVEQRNRINKLISYIRILDAKTSGAKNSEIAKYLYPHLNNCWPNAAGDKQISDDSSAARKYRDSKYKWLPLLSTLN